MTYAISTMIERLSKQKPKHVCSLSYRNNFWLNKYTDNHYLNYKMYVLDSCYYKYITKMCAKRNIKCYTSDNIISESHP